MYVYGLPVIEWAEEKLNDKFDHTLSQAIGIKKDDRIVCGVVYSNFRKTDVEMSVVCTDSKTWSKAALKTFFLYPFETLKCKRTTAIIAKRNKLARRFVQRLGFVLEGTMKDALDDDDACIYGMVKHQCKWI